jgi:hypothetical protein
MSLGHHCDLKKSDLPFSSQFHKQLQNQPLSFPQKTRHLSPSKRICFKGIALADFAGMNTLSKPANSLL